jgi:exosome complex component RRP4
MSKIIMPGGEVSKQNIKNAYSHSDEKGTYATVISLENDEGKIIPLEGPYQPNIDDYVIGHIIEIKFAGYDVDIAAPYRAFLSMQNVPAGQKFELGDIIIARIINVNEVRDIELAEPRLLKNGILIRISAVKVPRVIGKKNSMLNMITYATNTKIAVGKNGLIFISDDGDYVLASEVIKMIEKGAHLTGLTQQIAKYLEDKTKKPMDIEKIEEHIKNNETYSQKQQKDNQINYKKDTRPEFRSNKFDKRRTFSNKNKRFKRY